MQINFAEAKSGHKSGPKWKRSGGLNGPGVEAKGEAGRKLPSADL